MNRFLKTAFLALIGVIFCVAANAQGTWSAPKTVSVPSMTHGQMTYQVLLLNYSGTGTPAPIFVYEHENSEGDNCYQGGGCTYLPSGSGADGWYNNAAFQNRYCTTGCILLLPYADQTSDPSGQTSNFGGYGDTGTNPDPNELGVATMIKTTLSTMNADPNRVYVTGDSLGGIGSYAICLDRGIKTGTVEKLVTACMPFSGSITRAGGPQPTNAQVAQIQGGPFIFAINGPGDTGTSSNPALWSSPLWTDITGNSAYPGPPAGGVAGSSPYHYLLDPSLGHDVWDTYRPLPKGQPMLDLLFAQNAGGTTGGGGGTTGPGGVAQSPLPSGYLHTSGNQILDGAGNNVKMACSTYDKPSGSGATNDLAAIRAQGFNCIRVPWFDKTTCASGTCSFSAFDTIVNAALTNSIKVIFDHQGNEGVAGTNACTTQQKNGLWYDVNGAAPWTATNGTDGCGTAGTVTYATFKANWVQFAQHYNNNATVIGFDLHHEPTTYGNAACCGGTSTGTGAFHVQGGQIIDPNGNTFIAGGVNVRYEYLSVMCPTSACTSLTSKFPKGNAIRLIYDGGTNPYDSSTATYDPYIGWLTALGWVVEIEDHTGGNSGPPYTGQALTNEVNWYATLAARYKNNPRVWFGTKNEPYGPGITAQEVAIYNGIRATGSQAIVMMELPGGGNIGTVGTSGNVCDGSGCYGAMTASSYAPMTNIVWDLHFYPYVVNNIVGSYSTDIPTIQNVIRGSVPGAYGIVAAQTITSADGQVPVIIGEFGNSTCGAASVGSGCYDVDPDGPQVVTAVGTIGNGFMTFGWGYAEFNVPGNQIVNTANALTNPYGIQCATLADNAAQGGQTSGSAVFGANWGSGNGGDLRAMANDVGAAITAANPGALIIVEGVENNGTLFNGTPRGGGSTPSPTGMTNWYENPGQDGLFWKLPFQNSANFITSGPLVDAIRSGGGFIIEKGSYSAPWYIGQSTDPLVKVTDGTRTINVHLPLGAVVETPNVPTDNSIGGADATQPYLVWSISGASMNTGSVQASGSVITGTYGMTIQDGSGPIMMDTITGIPGSNNSIGGIMDFELAKMRADPNYVLPHMLAFHVLASQASPSATPIWPLKLADSGATGTLIPQGITIGIPQSVPRPTGKTRGFYAMWDQLQQLGAFNYNITGAPSTAFTIYSSDPANAALVTDIKANLAAVMANVAILNYNPAVAGSQFSLATQKGAVSGSVDAFPRPAPLDLSPTGGNHVLPSSFGAWYNSGYNVQPPITGGGGSPGTTTLTGSSFPAVSGIFMDLSTVQTTPLTCCAARLVFSPHDFPTSISSSVPDSGPDASTIRTTTWGYIVKNNFAPIWMGAIGASLDGTNGTTSLSDEQAWASSLSQYMNGQLAGQGGPTFTGCQQPMGSSWYDFGNNSGSQPDGTRNADGTARTGQQAIYNTLLYTTCSTQNSGGGAAGTTTTTAQRSGDFNNMLSIQGCLTGGGAPDCLQATQQVADLRYLGINHYRTGTDITMSGASLTALTALLNGGITLVTGTSYANPIVIANWISQAHGFQAINSNAIYALDGINEPELVTLTYQGIPGGDGTTWTPIATAMRDWIAAVLADAPLRALPIYGVSRPGAETNDAGLQFATVQGSHSAMPNGSVLGQLLNNHIYPTDQQFLQGGVMGACQPNDPVAGNSFAIQMHWDNVQTFNGGFSGYANDAAAKAIPHVATEFGYPISSPGPSPGGDRVTDLKRAHCILNGLLTGWQYGEQLISIYSMYDPIFGMFLSSGVPTTSGTYLHNFTAALADTGATARTFTPSALNYTLTGLPSHGATQLFQTSDGHFKMLIWDNSTNWNMAAGTPINVGPTNVTLTLGNGLISSMKQFDPAVSGSSPSQSVTSNSITVAVSDYPQIIDIAAASSQVGATTWNPNDLAGIVLTGSNFVATSTANLQSVRSTTSVSTGKVCFEAAATTITANWDFGLANASYNLAAGGGLGADTNGIGFDPNSSGGLQGIFYNNVPISTGTAASPSGEAQTICVDLGAHLFWATNATMRAGGKPWNNSATANPATGTGGLSFSGLTCPCFITFNEGEAGGVATLNAAGPFAVTTPSGFTSWQAPTVTTSGHPFVLITGSNDNWPSFGNDNMPFPFRDMMNLD